MHSVEPRINVIRIIAVALFFAIHATAYYAQTPGDTGDGERAVAETAAGHITYAMHVSVMLIVMAWTMQAMAVYNLAQVNWARPWMAPLNIVLDVTWLTCLLCLSRGPGSSLVAAYFLIIATSTWRLQVRWVRLATIAGVIGYLVVLGAAKWPIGILRDVPMLHVPRYHQALMLVALAMAGVIAGQTVRQAYGLLDRTAADDPRPSSEMIL